jgi:hypothetical protein
MCLRVNFEGHKEYVAQKDLAFRKTLVAEQGTAQDKRDLTGRVPIRALLAGAAV